MFGQLKQVKKYLAIRWASGLTPHTYLLSCLPFYFPSLRHAFSRQYFSNGIKQRRDPSSFELFGWTNVFSLYICVWNCKSFKPIWWKITAIILKNVKSLCLSATIIHGFGITHQLFLYSFFLRKPQLYVCRTSPYCLSLPSDFFLSFSRLLIYNNST